VNALLKAKRLIWAAVFALVTVVALVSYFSARRYVDSVSAVEHTMSVEAAIAGTLSLLKDAETGQRGFVLTGDPQFLEPYAAAKRDLPALVSQLRDLVSSDAEQRARLGDVNRLIGEKLAFIESSIALRRDRDLTQALLLVRTGRGKHVMDALRVELERMSKHEAQALTSSKQRAHAAERTALWGVGIGLLATSALALLSFFTAHRDVQELKRAAEEVAASEQHFRLLTEHTSDLVRLLDAKTGRATYVSPSVEHLLGYTVEEFNALPAFRLIHPDDLPAQEQLMRDLQAPVALSGISTHRLLHKCGEFRWFEARWVARQDASGQIVDVHTVARDVTARQLADAQLSKQAAELHRLSQKDELTGLYNRRGFLHMARASFREAQAGGRKAAVIFVDLNGMKRINDEQGHDVGDAALRDAASVLLAAHNESDVVARLGGDEFVVFALDFSPSELEPLRLRLRDLSDIETKRNARPYRLSMSVGAAFTPGSATSLEQLLDDADAAMYAQKNARRLAGGISIAPGA
jgi:diguanylate cyclase (GGDEF)-like protein/PAS domain S-box-containing protein